MPVCAGGSQPKASAPAESFFVGFGLSTLLEAIFPETFFAELAAFAVGQQYNTATLCATDPPAMPSFSASDVISILSPDPFTTSAGMAKLLDLIKIAAWYSMCQCTNATTPAAPSAPTYPAGAPVLNPNVAPAPISAPCWDVSNSVVVPNDGAWHYFTPYWLPSNEPITVTGTCNAGGNSTAYTIPSGVTQYTATIDVVISPPSVVGVDFIMAFYNSSLACLSQTTIGIYNQHPDGPHVYSVPVGAVYWQLQCHNSASNGVVNVTGEISFYCSASAPTTPITPCCPPDDTLTGMIAQIMAGLNAIYTALPSTPHSYSESTVHAGLTGSGAIAVGAGCLALKVAYTIGQEQGIAAGDPQYNFNVGFITTSLAEGNYMPTELHVTPQLIPMGFLADTFHYTLRAGVTATVTEITAGP